MGGLNMKIVNLSKQETKDLLALLNSSDNECFDRVIKKLKRKPIYKTIFYGIDGRFGNRVLKPQYRRWWRAITYGTLAFLLFKFVACPFFDWWDKVVECANYAIWS